MKNSPRRTVDTVGLPHAAEAERALIGMLLVVGSWPDISGRAIVQDIFDRVEAKHFFRQFHRQIFELAKETFDAGYDISPISILNHCGHARVEAVGGILAILNHADETAMLPMRRTYCAQVLEKYRLRESIIAADNITQRALAGETSDEIAAVISQTLTTIAKAEEVKPNSIGEISGRRLQELAEIQANPQASKLLPTGLADLDYLITGLGPGSLNYVGAYAKGGKTSFALSVMHNIAAAGKRILMFSMEMTGQEIVDRLLSRISMVPVTRIARAEIDRNDWRELADAHQKLADMKIVVSDTKRLTAKAIRAEAMNQADKTGLDMVVIDYLQLITSTQKFENRRVEVDTLSRELKIMAAELGVPVVALTQLSRASNDSSEPEIRHLREAGGQEADANLVLLLYRKDPEQMVVTCKVGANRNGPTGYADFAFLAEYGHMQNLLRDF